MSNLCTVYFLPFILVIGASDSSAALQFLKGIASSFTSFRQPEILKRYKWVLFLLKLFFFKFSVIKQRCQVQELHG